MLLYKTTLAAHRAGQLRAKLVKLVFRKLWVKGPYPKLWVLPGDTIGREILTHGLFEKDVLLALRNLLKKPFYKGGVLLDVGANIGNHTAFLAPLFKRVMAFEPNPLVFGILQANIAGNRLQNVTAVNKGLGARAGKLRFYQNLDNNLGASGFVKGKGSKPVGTFEVAVGDAELKRLGVKPADVRAVKIDVEGLETQVIAGLATTLKKGHPLVMFEVLDGAHGGKIVATLEKLGYAHFYELVEEKSWHGSTCRLLEVRQLGDRYYALVIASAKPL
jgi:FkbM family methyltransferase